MLGNFSSRAKKKGRSLAQRRSWARLGTTGQSGVHLTYLVLACLARSNWQLLEKCQVLLDKNHQTVWCAPDMYGALGGQQLCLAPTDGRAISTGHVSSTMVDRVTRHVRYASKQSGAHQKRKVANQMIRWSLHGSSSVGHRTVRCIRVYKATRAFQMEEQRLLGLLGL
jgi:hypothetical protein